MMLQYKIGQKLAAFFKNIGQNKRLLKNISYLSIIQIVTLITPFITYPYFVKVVGMSLYGEVLYYQAIMSYVGLVFNFGFNLTAVKYISGSNCMKEENQVITAILLIKSLLFVLMVLVGIFSYYIKVDFNYILILCSLSVVMNELLFPQWYFQAKEKLKYVSFLFLFVKLQSLILMFIFIKEQSDYYLIPLLTGVGYIIVSLVGFVLMYIDGVRIEKCRWSFAYSLAKDSFIMFSSNAIIAIKNKVDVLIIGALISKEMVVVYDLSIKMITMAQTPISILNNAIFSKMSNSKNKHTLNKLIKYGLLISACIAITFIIVLPYVLDYMLKGYLTSVAYNTCAILIISLPFFSVGVTLARNGLVVFGYNRLLLKSVIATVIFYFIGVALIFFLGLEGSLYSYAALACLVYMFESVWRFYLCRRLNLV